MISPKDVCLNFENFFTVIPCVLKDFLKRLQHLYWKTLVSQIDYQGSLNLEEDILSFSFCSIRRRQS